MSSHDITLSVRLIISIPSTLLGTSHIYAQKCEDPKKNLEGRSALTQVSIQGSLKLI
jgi:hypothetical protein